MRDMRFFSWSTPITFIVIVAIDFLLNLNPNVGFYCNKLILKRHLQNFNNPVLLENLDFRNYIQSYVSIESKKKLESGIYNGKDNQQLLADWATIDSLFSNREVNCYWKKDYLYNHIDGMGNKNVAAIYNEFMTFCKDTASTSQVRDIYNTHIEGRASHEIEIKKTVDNFNLEMHLFLPDQNVFKGERPTIVYLHGGSWSEGKPDWFFNSANEDTKQGWVATAVEYRIKGRHGNYPFESVKDSKTAIRWLRENANRYNIETNQIVVTGNSAGGHLALATSLVDTWNEESDDVSIDAKPNVVIVNSAVYDLTVENSKWIAESKADKNIVKEIAPNSLIKPSSTKFLLIHGENDRRCTFASAEYFHNKMKVLGSDIELHKIENADHFIWFGEKASQVYKITNDYIDKLEFE